MSGSSRPCIFGSRFLAAEAEACLRKKEAAGSQILPLEGLISVPEGYNRVRHRVFGSPQDENKGIPSHGAFAAVKPGVFEWKAPDLKKNLVEQIKAVRSGYHFSNYSISLLLLVSNCIT